MQSLQRVVVLALREIVPTLCRLRLLRLAARGKVIVETKENTMTTTLTIHDATKITTRGVMHQNSNRIVLEIETKGYHGTLQHQVTLFGLPTHFADAMEKFFATGKANPSLTEAEIRADERQKVESRINAIING
jgi:hypothetical protein